MTLPDILMEIVQNIHTKTDLTANSVFGASLPQLHAHLVAGMVVGSESIKSDQFLYDKLINCSLVHVVVVSGYNINLVLKGIESLLKLKYTKRSLFLLLFSLVFYMLACGLTPPVVRAGFMGFISYYVRFTGRAAAGLYIFLLTIFIMLVFNFSYIESISFWLSSAATAGLILMGEPLNNLFLKPVSYIKQKCPTYSFISDLYSFLAGELSTTLAATFFVSPIILYNFERLNLISPIYNVLSLWLIPLITVLGFIQLIIGLIFMPFSLLVGFITYVPVSLFIKLVLLFSYSSFGSISTPLSRELFIFYYICLFFCIVVIKVNKKSVA